MLFKLCSEIENSVPCTLLYRDFSIKEMVLCINGVKDGRHDGHYEEDQGRQSVTLGVREEKQPLA